MKKLMIPFLFVLIGTGNLLAQSGPIAQGNKGAYKLPYVIQGNDTLPVVVMDDVQFNEKLDQETIDKQKAWNTMVYDIIKVWPYASMCSGKMKQLNDDLASLDKKKEQKAYLKAEEEHLKSNYEEKLKNLNYRQGKVLIKLIDRETSLTSYDLIKEYKSGFTAFAYQSMATMFGMDLKQKYDPEKDVLIEQVLAYLGYK